MFYLLGHKLSSMTSTFDQKEKFASKLFILSVDGDTGFSPDAIEQLFECIKKDDQIGAACGRIHPKGSGIKLN